MAWTPLERTPEDLSCDDGCGHIWSSKHGGYCVICRVAARPKGPLPDPTPKKRPTFQNRASVIAEVAERDCGDASRYWCWYCTIPLAYDEVTLDHATPLAKGRKFHNRENIRLSCAWCNHTKGADDEATFRADRRLIERQRYVARLRAASLAASHPVVRVTSVT